MVYSVLPVEEERRSSTDAYYNDKSGLIVLDGPRGSLLARYLGDDEPDPDRFRFLARFRQSYPSFEEARPPSSATPDVVAHAWPVEEQRDPREGVVSGATGDVLGPPTGGQGPRKILSASTGTDKTVVDQEGIDIQESRIDIQAGGSGLSIRPDGVRVSGEFEQSSNQKKGLTRESPLRGTLPESIISFPFTGYLPNKELLTTIMGYVSIIRSAPSLIRSLMKAADQLTD